jgi:opacity protein-like surface antigen
MLEIRLKKVAARLALFAVSAMAVTSLLHAQALPSGRAPIVTPIPVPDHRDVQLALSFDIGDANLTTTNAFSFLFQGGSAEVSAQLFKGLGVTGSFTGLHASNSGQGVPVNLLAFTAGPRFTIRTGGRNHRVSLYGQGLVGGVEGFDGLYPTASGPAASATSLAYQTGGGIDIAFTPRIALRLLQADWLRTQLPDGTQNIENTLRIGIGIVYHFTAQ